MENIYYIVSIALAVYTILGGISQEVGFQGCSAVDLAFMTSRKRVAFYIFLWFKIAFLILISNLIFIFSNYYLQEEIVLNTYDYLIDYCYVFIFVFFIMTLLNLINTNKGFPFALTLLSIPAIFIGLYTPVKIKLSSYSDLLVFAVLLITTVFNYFLYQQWKKYIKEISCLQYNLFQKIGVIVFKNGYAFVAFAISILIVYYMHYVEYIVMLVTMQLLALILIIVSYYTQKKEMKIIFDNEEWKMKNSFDGEYILVSQNKIYRYLNIKQIRIGYDMIIEGKTIRFIPNDNNKA